MDTSNIGANLLTIFILGSLILIVYLKWTKKTLKDFIWELREAFAEPPERVLP